MVGPWQFAGDLVHSLICWFLNILWYPVETDMTLFSAHRVVILRTTGCSRVTMMNGNRWLVDRVNDLDANGQDVPGSVWDAGSTLLYEKRWSWQR